MEVRHAIGLNVRRFRLAAGLTQEELGARIGVEQFYVSGLESGDRNPTARTIWLIATVFGVDPGKLFAGATRAKEKSKAPERKSRSVSKTSRKGNRKSVR